MTYEHRAAAIDRFVARHYLAPQALVFCPDGHVNLTLDDYAPDLDWHTVVEGATAATHVAEYDVEGVALTITYSDTWEVPQ